MGALSRIENPLHSHNPPLESPLEIIFRENHRKVFAAAYRLTGNANDAEDVLQTVFIRLLKRGDELDLSPSPGAYLHRAGVNAALDLLRSRSRKRSVPLDDLSVAPSSGEETRPDRLQHDRDLRRGLRQAMLGLSDRAAEIFSLRFFEGLPNQEIAASLGMTQSAVGVALHRARNQIKKEIRSFVGDY